MLIATGLGCSRGDAVVGEARAVTCLGCHGSPVRATAPNIPRIAGQSQVYLAKQLRDYRDGHRSDPVMTPLAGSLDDAQIDDIAAYFAALAFCEDAD
jgi:cytochrome c553